MVEEGKGSELAVPSSKPFGLFKGEIEKIIDDVVLRKFG